MEKLFWEAPSYQRGGKDLPPQRHAVRHIRRLKFRFYAVTLEDGRELEVHENSLKRLGNSNG